MPTFVAMSDALYVVDKRKIFKICVSAQSGISSEYEDIESI